MSQLSGEELRKAALPMLSPKAQTGAVLVEGVLWIFCLRCFFKNLGWEWYVF